MLSSMNLSSPVFEVYTQTTKYWFAVPLDNKHYLAVWGPRAKTNTFFPLRATAKIVKGSLARKINEKKDKGGYAGGVFFKLQDLDLKVKSAIEDAVLTASAFGLTEDIVRTAVFGKEESNPSFILPDSPVTKVTENPWNI
jgi:hypothetical protein